MLKPEAEGKHQIKPEQQKAGEDHFPSAAAHEHEVNLRSAASRARAQKSGGPETTAFLGTAAGTAAATN